MEWRTLLGGAVIIAIGIGILMALDVFGAPVSAPLQVQTTEPTDFLEVGTLTFNTPGLQQDTMHLVYEKPGAPALTRELVLDEMSFCVAENGATPCMAMSVQFHIPFDGKRAMVEGTAQSDGTILVRKLRVLREGEMPLSMDPGRVFISWPQAVSLIKGCEVTMIMQTHSQDVHLDLKDGRSVVTVSPLIDDVFRVHQEAQVCGQIPVATE